MFAVVILPGVSCDLVHPGAEWSTGTIALRVFQDAEENILHEVFTRRPIAGEPAIEIKERILVAVEQHRQHFSDAFAYLQHKLFVWKRIRHCAMRLGAPGLPFSSPAETSFLSKMKTEHRGKGYSEGCGSSI